MRPLIIAMALLPLPALADLIPVSAPITTVTVLAQGALVTREVQVDLPAGRHTIRLDDMDADLWPNAIDVDLTGASLVTRTWHGDGTGPYRAPRTDAWLAARAALDTAQDALNAHTDAIARAQARARAAQDQIDFLNGIALPDGTAADVDTLRAIGQLISSDGTAARAAIAEAQAEARSLARQTPDLTFAVDQAQAALDAATPPNTAPATLDLGVLVPEATQAKLTLRYPTRQAQWEPFYTLTLTDEDQLLIDRSALIQQRTNEDWTGVALTLSTLNLSAQTEPGFLRTRRRRIEDPAPPAPVGVQLRSQVQADSFGSPAEPVIEAPVIVEEMAAVADFSGVGVTYALPGSTTVPSGGTAVSLALDTLTLDADLTARAVPRRDTTAFRAVHVTNTTPEILLPADAILYVEDQVVGESRIELLPPNAEVEVFFGAIEGLRIDRTVLDRNEGDRGLISRTNEEQETVRIDVENLTGRSWQVDLRDAVPFSEQEDLEITWSARPAPTQENVEDRRGILSWELDLAPGAKSQITVDTQITWPEDKILR